jgi:hypothetical protein
MYRRAIEDFERLKALRPELPNEPIDLEQPEEKPDLATLEDLNMKGYYSAYHPDPNITCAHHPWDDLDPTPQSPQPPASPAQSS